MRRLTIFLRCLGTLLPLLPYWPAYAQNIPRSVEADTLGKGAVPAPQPSVPPLIEAAPSLAVAAPEGAEKIHLTLKQVVVDRSTVYTPTQLAEYSKELVGKVVTVADLYTVAARITQRYRKDGYDFSKAVLPPQDITAGIVHIRVIEGTIKHIRWTGDVPDSSVMLDLAEKLLAMHPLNGRMLESIILRLNALPGLQVHATMTPDQEEGAVVVLLEVQRKRVSGTLSLNDDASRYSGIWQSTVQTEVTGLVSSVDKLSLALTSSVETMFSRFESAQYSVPINADGTTLLAGASKSHSAPGFTLTPLQIRSDADYAWFGLSQPLLLTREESLTVSSQFNIHNIKTDLLGTAFYEDRIRTLQLSGAYNVADNWGGSNLLNVDIFKGLNILNATPDGAAMLSRPTGHSDFIKMVVNASRLQTIGQNLSLLTAATGQITNVPLLTSEQFGYGGMAFGRAYDPSQISGDEGMAGSLELRYNDAISEQVGLQPYLFYDIGEVWDRSTPNYAMSGASAGLGLRCQFSTYGQLDINLAKPLTLPAAPPKLGAYAHDPRLNISFQLSY